MQPTPPGWLRFSSAVIYEDAARAIDWLCDAFGFEVRLRVVGPEGRIVHSELTYGEGVIMVAQQSPPEERSWRNRLRSPRALGGANTQSLAFFVDDADAHCAHARARGARIIEEPRTTDHGAEYWTDRSYAALDPEQHLWWVIQRIETRNG